MLDFNLFGFLGQQHELISEDAADLVIHLLENKKKR